MLAAKGLKKTYGAVEAVRGIDLDVRPGSIVGLVGNNGAGKTTTLKMLAGLVAPTDGSVRIAGADPQVPATRQRLGFLPEDSPLYEEQTPRAYLRFFGAMYGLPRRQTKERTEQLFDRLRLDDGFRGRPIGQLSKGSARKVAIARALLHDPDVLLLDEPTSGLDPATQAELDAFLAELRDEGKAILLSAHDMRQVEALCDRVVLMHAGRIVVQGTLAELRDGFGGTTYDVVATAPFPGSVLEGSHHRATFQDLAAAEEALEAVRRAGGTLLRMDTHAPGIDAILAQAVRRT